MMSKTRISKRARKKTNSELVETILLCKENNQLELGKIISGPTRNLPSVNLDEIDKEAKEGETVIIPGKVLGNGDLNKKIKIIALGFSKSAEEKLKKRKIEILTIKKAFESKKMDGRIIK